MRWIGKRGAENHAILPTVSRWNNRDGRFRKPRRIFIVKKRPSCDTVTRETILYATK